VALQLEKSRSIFENKPMRGQGVFAPFLDAGNINRLRDKNIRHTVLSGIGLAQSFVDPLAAYRKKLRIFGLLAVLWSRPHARGCGVME
jgi:hypothetical protein